MKAQTGITEPMRDWFPLSALGPFSDLVDQLMGDRADWGSMKCGCHPNCGIGTVLMVNKKTQQIVPLTQFLDMEGLLDDIGTITDGAQAQAAHGGAAGAGAGQELPARQGAAGLRLPRTW